MKVAMALMIDDQRERLDRTNYRQIALTAGLDRPFHPDGTDGYYQ